MVFNQQDTQSSPVVIARRNPDPAGLRSKFDRVVDQVPKNLLQTRRIGVEISFFGAEIDLKTETFAIDLALINFKGVLKKLMSIDDFEVKLHFPFADPGHVQQIVDQTGFELDIAANELKRFADACWQILFLFKRQHRCEDGRERRS